MMSGNVEKCHFLNVSSVVFEDYHIKDDVIVWSIYFILLPAPLGKTEIIFAEGYKLGRKMTKVALTKKQKQNLKLTCSVKNVDWNY